MAFPADIKQMYRQVLLIPAHRDCQRILWRSSREEPMKEFRLNTVTYGLSSAPYHALRTIQLLADAEKSHYPLASIVLGSDTSEDDIVSGCNALEEAVTLQHELIALCHAGGFEHRKRTSNCLEFLEGIPQSSCQDSFHQSILPGISPLSQVRCLCLPP